MPERKLPAWYSEPDWMHAKIEMGDRGSVTILEPAYDKVEEYSQLLLGKKIKGVEVTARIFALYIESSTDPSMPARGAEPARWVEWLKSGVENVWVERVGNGITIFRQRDEDNEVPN